ncbi:hypothetical protein ABIB42_001897 [Massilia sp. UYP32]|uniref:hypothetical protein n=1 Tax=Massilia sp. UYP32 TaxID=1756386 RepID=UPI003D221678
MFELTEDQLAMRDLRLAAYHEAGHKAMYHRFGGAGDAVVWENLNRSPDEIAWRGQFRPRTCPQVMHNTATRHGMPAADLPDNWRTLYGMAGLVAEEILRGETDPDFVAGALDIKIACGEVSASDLKSMGITNIADFELNSEEVEQAWRFLLEDWSLVQEEAEYLIAEALEQQLHHRQAYSPNVIVKCCP